MRGFEVYKIFFAIQLHFNSDSYDYFKYNGKCRESTVYSSYQKRRDRIHFEIIGREFSREELINIFFAYFMTYPNDSHPIGKSILNFAKSGEYRKWKSNIQNVEYYFQEDLKKIKKILSDNDKKFKHLLKPSKSSHLPPIVLLVKRGHIRKETYIILDSILNLTSKMNKLLDDDDILWNNWKNNISKNKELFEIDKKKYRNYLTNTLESFIMKK